MSNQKSLCCHADIKLTGKERPDAFECTKCGRIIGSELPTEKTLERSVEEIVRLIVEMKVHGDEELEEDVRAIIQAERQKREEVVGWKGYVVVDPETDYYTYSNVFFKKSEAEKKLKDFDVNGLKVIEVDVTLTQPNNKK